MTLDDLERPIRILAGKMQDERFTEILVRTLFMFTFNKQSTFYFDSTAIVNFCRNFMKIVLKESYLTNITYVQVTVTATNG